MQNNELSSKLRRAEHVNTRVSEELAKYRTAQGKPSALNVEEEQRLRSLLQEVEEQRDLEAQKLARLCASVIKAAGIADGDAGTPPAVAVEAVQQLKLHSETIRQEFEDFKIKVTLSPPSLLVMCLCSFSIFPVFESLVFLECIQLYSPFI